MPSRPFSGAAPLPDAAAPGACLRAIASSLHSDGQLAFQSTSVSQTHPAGSAPFIVSILLRPLSTANVGLRAIGVSVALQPATRALAWR